MAINESALAAQWVRIQSDSPFRRMYILIISNLGLTSPNSLDRADYCGRQNPAKTLLSDVFI